MISVDRPLPLSRVVIRRPRHCAGGGPFDAFGMLVKSLPESPIVDDERLLPLIEHLIELAHQRWAIEQQYQELKDELGLDHFEGRSFPGWHRHIVLTAVAYAWLQHERRRRGARLPTLPMARAVMTEILTAHFFVTHPHYLKTMLKLQEIQLLI